MDAAVNPDAAAVIAVPFVVERLGFAEVGSVSGSKSSVRSVVTAWQRLALMPDSATASATASEQKYISLTEVTPKRRHSAMDSSAAALTLRASMRSSCGKMLRLSHSESGSSSP